VGSIEFISVKDINTNMGKSILLNPAAEAVKKAMYDDQNPSSINAFVVKTADKTILIDAGTGSGGNLLKNLELAGVTPDTTDIVIITHMHSDHIGGLAGPKAEKVFTSAQVYVAAEELRYWLNAVSSEKNAARTLKAVYADKLKTFEWDENIIPEIKAIGAPGHTPGHTMFEISSGDDKILVIGDLVHNIKVQTIDPSISVVFDSDPKQAAAVRKKIFKDAARSKTKIAGMHIPFPGVGYLSEDSAGKYFFNPSYR
jgi:glyoxylase-like metal-dependent hydrolase (beta-lactamase superfamily II)